MPQESLFGLPPELLQQQQQAAQQGQAMDFARLDPYQQATFGAYSGGQALGNAVGNMGGGDPMMQLARMRQSVLSEIDPNDPASYQTAAKKLLQAKDYQGAQHLVSAAQSMVKAGSEARYKDAETAAKLSEKLTTEQKNAAAMADSQGLQRGTPEWVGAYKEHLTTLTGIKDKGEVKEVGVAEGTKEPVYLLKKDGVVEQFVMRKVDGKQVKVPYEGAVDRTTAKTNVNVKGPETIQESAFSKELGVQNAKRLNDTMEGARTSALALRTLGNMESKNAQGIYSGPQAQVVKDTSNFLESVGLLSKDQTKKLTDSTTYDKFAKDLVMQDLGGKLGAQVSDADRKFVEDRIPQLTTNPQARVELIAKLKELHTKKIDYYRKMQAHANKNHNLNDFDFADADSVIPSAAPATTAAASDSDLINKYLKK